MSYVRREFQVGVIGYEYRKIVSAGSRSSFYIRARPLLLDYLALERAPPPTKTERPMKDLAIFVSRTSYPKIKVVQLIWLTEQGIFPLVISIRNALFVALECSYRLVGYLRLCFTKIHGKFTIKYSEKRHLKRAMNTVAPSLLTAEAYET